MPMRPASSTCSVLMNPSCSAPSSASAGTRQSRKTTSLVSLARMPSLSSFRPGVIPGLPRSTMNAEMPRWARALSVTAITTITSPMLPWVMNVLVPLMTHPSPSRAADTRIAAASDPAVGSVSPQAPIHAPVASGTRYRRFCASVPNIAMCAAQRPLCAATDSDTDGSTRASSSMQMQ